MVESQETRPARRRRLTLRGAFLGLVALVVALALAHLFWGSYERSRFMAEVNRYRAAGDPVLPEDFDRLAVSGPANPAPEWLAAGAAVVDTNLNRFSSTGARFPLSAPEETFLQELVAANASALAHARAASRLAGPADWGIHYSQAPAMFIRLSHLNTQRQLARVLAADALEAHQRGDDAHAIECIRQIMAQRRAVLQEPGLVCHLVALGITSLACETLDEMSPGLAIGTTGQAASPEQVRRLTDELLNDQPLRAGQRQAFLGERMFEADSAMQVVRGNLSVFLASSPAGNSKGVKFTGYLLRPVIYGDARLCIDYITRIMQVAQSPDWPACERNMQALPPLATIKNPRHLFASIMLPAFDRVLTYDFRIMTEMRLSATALAARAYAVDHDGRQSEALSDLVPRYLPAVPADPMTPGSPLRLRASDPAAVYSVGSDGIDDGGSEQRNYSDHPNDRWALKDVVVRLQPRPRTDEDSVIDHSLDLPPDAASAPATEPATDPATQPQDATAAAEPATQPL